MILKCYKDLLANKKIASGNSFNTCAGPDKSDLETAIPTVDGDALPSLIPKSSKRIANSCLFNREGNKKLIKNPKKWFDQGHLPSYKENALDIGGKFNPRCF